MCWFFVERMKIKKDLKIHVTHWWQEETARHYVRQMMGRNEGHAGLEESAAMLVARPELVQLEHATAHSNVPEDIWSRPPAEVRGAVPSGAVGANPAQANKEVGEGMLNLLVEEYERLITKQG